MNIAAHKFNRCTGDRFAFVALATASLLVCSNGLMAQGYTLKPGPRGYNPDLNPYGTTEAPQSAAQRLAALRQSDPTKTTVTIELLLAEGAGPLEAQRWLRVFETLGYGLRVRTALPSEKPELKETHRGPLRSVVALGSLDRHGKLVFPSRSFSTDETGDLKQWLDNLKVYGAQGSPQGQPLWGLNRSQFEEVYSRLARQFPTGTAGAPLATVFQSLPTAPDYPVRLSAAAEQVLAAKTVAERIDAPENLTTGTTLAYLLNSRGLGFRPARTPAGSIELLVESLPPSRDVPDAPPTVWPVGWNVAETAQAAERPVSDKNAVPPSRVELAPTLFRMEPISVQPMSLTAAARQITAQAAVPVLLDYAALRESNVDPDAVTVQLPARRTSWSVAVRSLLFPHRLQAELRRDEAGHPFLWVSTLSRPQRPTP